MVLFAPPLYLSVSAKLIFNLQQSFDDSDEGQSNLAQARIYLLNLLATSMASAWQHTVRFVLALLLVEDCAVPALMILNNRKRRS